MNREELRRLVIGGGLVLLGLILFFGRFSIAEFFSVSILCCPARLRRFGPWGLSERSYPLSD